MYSVQLIPKTSSYVHNIICRARNEVFPFPFLFLDILQVFGICIFRRFYINLQSAAVRWRSIIIIGEYVSRRYVSGVCSTIYNMTTVDSLIRTYTHGRTGFWHDQCGNIIASPCLVVAVTRRAIYYYEIIRSIIYRLQLRI